MQTKNPAHNSGAGFGLSDGQADFTSSTKFLHAQNHNQQVGFTHVTLADLSRLAKNPRIGSKASAPIFAPHDGTAKTKDAALAAQFHALILDFDDGDHDAASIQDLLRDVAYLAWTSSSHTLEKQRWKVVIPFSRAIGATAWIPIAGGAALTYGADPAQARVQQVCYTPNKLADGAPYTVIDKLEGRPLDPTGSLAQGFVAKFETSRVQVAAKATPKPSMAPKGSTDIIRMVNQAYDVRSVLEQNGYQKRGKKYLAPNSTSGFPGVHILAGDDGERVYSHHSLESDPIADGHSHDVFDLLVEFRFHGNVGEAVKTLAAELDGDGQAQRQRDYMAEKGEAASLAKPNDEGDEADYLTPPPTMRPAMLYGLIGDIATKASEGREVNAVSVALAALVRLSALVGRDVYIQIGDERHTLNQFGLHVGRSALAACRTFPQGQRKIAPTPPLRDRHAPLPHR